MSNGDTEYIMDSFFLLIIKYVPHLLYLTRKRYNINYHVAIDGFVAVYVWKCCLWSVHELLSKNSCTSKHLKITSRVNI